MITLLLLLVLAGPAAVLIMGLRRVLALLAKAITAA
jgi:hypothetical protein